MSWRTVLASVMWAASVGLLVAVFNGEDQVVSLQIWFAAFAGWLAASLVVRLLGNVPPSVPPLLGLWTWRNPPPSPAPDYRPRDLRSFESLVLRSQSSARAYSQQLRPRLTALAVHSLQVNHGVDVVRDATRGHELLDDVSWMIDPSYNERCPTLSELDRFLTLVDPPARP